MVPGGSLWMIDSDGARAGPGERCAPALAFLPPLSPRSVHFRLEIGRVPRRDRFEVPACRSPGAPGAAAPRTATAPRIFNVPHCPTHTAKSRNHAGPRSASRPSDVLELRGLITSPAFRLSHRDDWLPSSRARWQMPAGLREPISSRRSTDLGEGGRGAGKAPAPCRHGAGAGCPDGMCSGRGLPPGSVCGQGGSGTARSCTPAGASLAPAERGRCGRSHMSRGSLPGAAAC